MKRIIKIIYIFILFGMFIRMGFSQGVSGTGDSLRLQKKTESAAGENKQQQAQNQDKNQGQNQDQNQNQAGNKPVNNQQGNSQNQGGTRTIKQVHGARPDMSRARGARPPNIVRPSGSGIPKGIGKPGGAARPGKR